MKRAKADSKEKVRENGNSTNQGIDEVDLQGTFPFDMGDQMMTRKILPSRYQIRENDVGRYLTCADAPNLDVHVRRGFSVSSSAARKYPEHSIFLDGAAQGEPFIDSNRRVLNLDHHEGCVRSFTLATCEQAMVMVLKGLDLDGEKWTIYASEPDLDTVLSIWILLNHRRLTAVGSRIRRSIMPLVRLEGVIDAHGFELSDLTGFPTALQKSTHELIDRLREVEVEERGKGEWAQNDPLDYTVQMLMAIDAEAYEPGDFSDDAEVEELERIPLVGDRFAIACRAEIGIYEVEQYLRGIYGDRLSLILLERDPGIWTLRQVNPFLPFGLEALFDRLNLLDPVVKGDNRWGGSAEIGGSPRRGASGLDLHEIASVCRWVFRPPTGAQRIRAAAVGIAFAVGFIALAGLAILPIKGAIQFPGLVATAEASAAFSVCLAVVAVGAAIIGGRRTGAAMIGMRWPAGGRWPWLGLIALIAALAGGGWGALVDAQGVIQSGWSYATYLGLGAAAAELVFRGVAHGLLAQTFPIMISKGHWFLSLPVLLMATTSAVFSLVLFLPTSLLNEISSSEALGLGGWVTAALVMGLVSGLIRERSASVWPALAFHAASVACVWTVLTAFG